MARTALFFLVGLGLTLAGVGILPCEGSGAWERPAYQLLRQDEDWSGLARLTAGEPEDLFDPVKYLPLNRSGTVWASFGGQVRERMEGWRHFNFGAPAGADDTDIFFLTRLLLHGDLHIGSHLRLFAQGKGSFSADRDLTGGRRTSDVDELDLQNGFMDLMAPLDSGNFTLRTGRQELLFGKQHLVSPSNFSNVRRTFDGISAILERGGWKVTGFWTQFVPVRKYEFNWADPNTRFFGVYGAGGLPFLPVGLDLFWLGLDTDTARFNDGTGREKRHTLGGRLWGVMPGSALDYDIIGAYQFGDLESARVDAFMFTLDLGYRLERIPGAPRVYLGFDYASGDAKPGDNQLETFNKLFPTGHAFLGYADVVGRQNIVDLRAGVSWTPLAKLTAVLDWHNFWRASDRDALYSPGGAIVRPGEGGSSREVGHEIDLILTYRVDRHWAIGFCYGHFFAGRFIAQSGPSKDIDFVYLMPQFTF